MLYYYMLKYFLNYYKLLIALLIILCNLSISGAIIYYIYALNQLGLIISLILASIICAAFVFVKLKYSPSERNFGEPENEKNNKFDGLDYLLTAIYLILASANFYLLYHSQTANPIISPWQVVSPWFWLLYLTSTLSLFALIIKQYQNNNQQNLNYFYIFLISLHYFLSFSVAWLVYQIGYGFDPFIHRATMELIDKVGAVSPKPLYYLGQYSLTIILHKLTNLPIIWLDKLLVPILAALYLPAVLYQVAQKWFNDNRTSLLLIILLLSLPFGFFIVTTPQNLAYLFLLLIILLGIICRNLFDLLVIYLLAVAALLIQPIAGIPAVLAAIFLTIFYSDNQKIKKIGPWLIFILAAISLPLAFYFLEKNNGLSNQTMEPATAIFSWPNLAMPGAENFILNFIYLYGLNLKLVIFLLVIVGMAIAWQHRQNCRVLMIYFIMSLALLMAYLGTKTLPFSFLINYERDNYAARILLVSVFFLAPFILITLYWLLAKIIKQNYFIKLAWLLFFAVLITASLYLSYPRFDRYFNSHGYSVSASDISAVQWIAENSSGDYIVLANQQVSAAAVRQYGFSHYYKNNIFYYPIPTGGPLYNYYLKMVYQKPSRQTMAEAMNLADVREGYFVLNKYWWAFDKILDKAKLEAQSWQEINQGQVYIFKY